MPGGKLRVCTFATFAREHPLKILGIAVFGIRKSRLDLIGCILIDLSRGFAEPLHEIILVMIL